MKVAIITDQHFGFKKGSKLFHEYFQKFYEETFFQLYKNVESTLCSTLGILLIIVKASIYILWIGLKKIGSIPYEIAIYLLSQLLVIIPLSIRTLTALTLLIFSYENIAIYELWLIQRRLM